MVCHEITIDLTIYKNKPATIYYPLLHGLSVFIAERKLRIAYHYERANLPA
jgi:hypothetical protein